MGESPDRSNRTAGEEREAERADHTPASATPDVDPTPAPSQGEADGEEGAGTAGTEASVGAAAEDDAADAAERRAEERAAGSGADVDPPTRPLRREDIEGPREHPTDDAEETEEAGEAASASAAEAEESSAGDAENAGDAESGANGEGGANAGVAESGENGEEARHEAQAEDEAAADEEAEPASAPVPVAVKRAIRDPRLPAEPAADAEPEPEHRPAAESAAEPEAEPLPDFATRTLRIPPPAAAPARSARSAGEESDGADDESGDEGSAGVRAAGRDGRDGGRGPAVPPGAAAETRAMNAFPRVPLPPVPPLPSAGTSTQSEAGAPAGATAVAVSPESTIEAMDILAGLSARPMTPARIALRRIRLWGILLLVLVVVLGAVQLFRPLPSPKLAMTAATNFAFDGGAPQLDWPVKGQAAVEVPGLGVMGHSGSDDPVPLASVTKVMTAYVILHDKPLKKGEQGPSLTVDQQAVNDYVTGTAGQESVMKVSVGEQLTEYQALQMLLIPSANNIARLLGRWDAGSQEAFVQKMQATAVGLGMTKTTYTDPSGLTSTTKSTANDQLMLEKAAMADPVFREIVGTASFTPPENGLIQNNNGLLLRNGVIGVKTGSSSAALGNLMWAARQKAGDTTETLYGVVLSQPAIGGDGGGWLPQVLAKSKKLIISAEAALQSHVIAKKGDVVGYVDDGLGGRTPVVATQDVSVAGWGGLSVQLSLKPLAGATIPHSAPAGTTVGELVVGSGAGAQTVPVTLQSDLGTPGFGEKLTRLT
ncbi:D-alanyl-D-alanine carboxypeptidase family protein [Streptacidiphilus rugosus]|uniref:D-alanyl-D-alanine carboxypeptidase family protein n=1 Tax=Streptacidiphilus rugosus TaxID=405783 RepID=UPI00068C0AAA|nr:D-alanyl-D-alanine carboxypeptidase [Streptacidiphilus rugosus]